ncbi:hypothetical protein [Pseudomonas sp. GV071]|uniref:hypothetical protein n=1 Tax=Pseudomonas sp. GV071 TaxID=2135754 RepID=UPI000D33B2B6|nr:hypothetical protein [Pseudomonas sp. GV071]
MIVPPDGGRPVVARVVGSDDQRFEASAYAMAMAFVYQPMICQGIAHEAFVVAPFHFGPRPLMSR